MALPQITLRKAVSNGDSSPAAHGAGGGPSRGMNVFTDVTPYFRAAEKTINGIAALGDGVTSYGRSRDSIEGLERSRAADEAISRLRAANMAESALANLRAANAPSAAGEPPQAPDDEAELPRAESYYSRVGLSAKGAAAEWLEKERAYSARLVERYAPEHREEVRRAVEKWEIAQYGALARHERAQVRSGTIAKIDADSADASAQIVSLMMAQVKSATDTLQDVPDARAEAYRTAFEDAATQMSEASVPIADGIAMGLWDATVAADKTSAAAKRTFGAAMDALVGAGEYDAASALLSYARRENADENGQTPFMRENNISAADIDKMQRAVDSAKSAADRRAAAEERQAKALRLAELRDGLHLAEADALNLSVPADGSDNAKKSADDILAASYDDIANKARNAGDGESAVRYRKTAEALRAADARANARLVRDRQEENFDRLQFEFETQTRYDARAGTPEEMSARDMLATAHAALQNKEITSAQFRKLLPLADRKLDEEGRALVSAVYERFNRLQPNAIRYDAARNTVVPAPAVSGKPPQRQSVRGIDEKYTYAEFAQALDLTFKWKNTTGSTLEAALQHFDALTANTVNNKKRENAAAAIKAETELLQSLTNRGTIKWLQ